MGTECVCLIHIDIPNIFRKAISSVDVIIELSHNPMN